MCFISFLLEKRTDLLRKAAHLGDKPGGVGGGVSDVATWNRAAKLFVNSGHGGFPVAVKENEKKKRKAGEGNEKKEGKKNESKKRKDEKIRRKGRKKEI